ncbi:MAG TPA: beta-ketoacyl-[acyl-carrier-protein] synthase family protein [Steroidobacter sp.]|uniref:beta-ketoacyl-[acyl-carrier-protein] synthase family protein n=1 Tax=Steroidobacter sp. TaxID=1978227 RepID=UPI002EDAE261
MQFGPLRITAYSLCSAAGDGQAATLAALRERRSGLTRNDFGPAPIATWIGRVPGLEERALPAELANWDCRNNRLAWRGLVADEFIEAVRAARERYGAGRVAVIVGTSTSSIGASEEAYTRLDADGQCPADLRRPIIHTPHSLGDFVQNALGLTGISMTVGTACSSSAKVFAQAERLIRTGLADAAVVGGVDTLCGSVLFGFNSLELVSPEPCRPFDVGRRGINLGEAAGFALLEKQSQQGAWLLGYGESSDAHHMSTPHPEGLGARLALSDALQRAELKPEDIDYINLHGTASQKNDDVEAKLVAELFPATTCASSTKGWTGHTLGAAGIIEAAICLLALEHQLLPGTLNLQVPDAACGPQIQRDNVQRKASHALSFSFGFGGSNCVLVFGRDR